MMDLNTIEMRGRYDTKPAIVSPLNEDDGEKQRGNTDGANGEEPTTQCMNVS